jgi:hypothetical protein
MDVGLARDAERAAQELAKRGEVWRPQRCGLRQHNQAGQGWKPDANRPGSGEWVEECCEGQMRMWYRGGSEAPLQVTDRGIVELAGLR